MSVKDIDLGWKKIKKELDLMNDSYVKIGVQEGSIARDGTMISTYAAANEFGAQGGRIPERSFMRSSHDENAKKYSAIFAAQTQAIFSGQSTVKKALGLAGSAAQADMKKKIASNIPPENADSTKAQKGAGKTSTLINTGDMLRSIQYVVVT